MGWMTFPKVINSFPGLGRLGDQSHSSSSALWCSAVPPWRNSMWTKSECQISASLPKIGMCGSKCLLTLKTTWSDPLPQCAGPCSPPCPWWSLSLNSQSGGSMRTIMVHHKGVCGLCSRVFHLSLWLSACSRLIDTTNHHEYTTA